MIVRVLRQRHTLALSSSAKALTRIRLTSSTRAKWLERHRCGRLRAAAIQLALALPSTPRNRARASAAVARSGQTPNNMFDDDVSDEDIEALAAMFRRSGEDARPSATVQTVHEETTARARRATRPSSACASAAPAQRPTRSRGPRHAA